MPRTNTSDSKLQRLRVKRRLTQKELSEMTGTSISQIMTFENKTRSIETTHLDRLLSFCIALHCQLEDILEDDDIIQKLEIVKNISEDDFACKMDIHRDFDSERELYNKFFNLEEQNLSEDQKEGIRYLLTDFPERWQIALKLRYVDMATHNVIAQTLDISVSRVGQLIERGVERLRELEESGYVVYGLNGYREMLKKEADTRPLSEISIAELQLSGRAYNSLMRAGLDTIEKIAHMSEADFFEVKSMTRETAQDTFNKLQAFIMNRVE